MNESRTEASLALAARGEMGLRSRVAHRRAGSHSGHRLSAARVHVGSLEPHPADDAERDQRDPRALLRDASERLLAISETVFDAGSPEAAFHCLESALHLAELLNDLALAERVDAMVLSQEKCIESVAEERRKTADRQRTRTVYQSLHLRFAELSARLQAARDDRLGSLDGEMKTPPGG
jgi:hypothetical protein